MADKQCTKCGEVKPLESFHVRSDTGRRRNECGQCLTHKAAEWKRANRERARENNRVSYHRDIERTRQVKKAWREVNKDKVAQYQKGYLAKPEAKAKKQVRDAKWKQLNPDKVAKYGQATRANNPQTYKRLLAKRRAAQRNATPGWYEPELVKKVYEEATRRGYEVDHVVPLVNDKVCGLHCWANLQLMTRRENISKGNRHWPDMW